MGFGSVVWASGKGLGLQCPGEGWKGALASKAQSSKLLPFFVPAPLRFKWYA